MSPFAPIALLLTCAAAAKPAQIERRIERELPAAAVHAAVAHSYGGCTVYVVPDGQKPRARLDLVATGGDGGGRDGERRFLDGADLSITSERSEEGDALTIRPLFPPMDEKPADVSFAAELTLWLPAACALVLDNGFGPVVVAGRRGDVTVRNKIGPIDVRDVVGAVHASNQFDSITIRDVTGDVYVDGKISPVTVERASGFVQVRTRGAALRVEGAGSAHLESHMAPVRVAGVRGEARVIAPFCAVTAREIGGKLVIESGNESVDVEGVAGDLEIGHRNGRVAARRIGGRATVNGNLSEISVEDVGGDAELRTAAASLVVAGVRGRLFAENSARPIEIKDARGDVEARSSGGLLRATFLRLPASDLQRSITLEAAGGALELALPRDASVALEAASTAGLLECAFPGMSISQSGATRFGALRLGEGRVKLTATCSGGAVRVTEVVSR